MKMKIQRSDRDGCIVLTLSGSLDPNTATPVRHALLKALAEQPDAVICDLSGVATLNPVCATEFAAVASHPAASRWPRTAIALCRAQPAVAAALRRLGGRLESSLNDTVDQALDHATRPPLRRERHRLVPTIQARAAARQLLAEVGSKWRLHGQLVEQVQRIAAELVAEAITNAPTRIILHVELRGDELFLAVHDDRSPMLHPAPDLRDEPDWVLRTVAQAATAWGVDWHAEGGKVVWCTLKASA
jgi:anti-anti-sigma regulatory factor/anti-sigma regulatory factor (Ser/Thr protein kinase)